MCNKDHRGVWVYAEQRDGEVQKVGYELLGKGREIAEKLGTELVAVLLGNNMDAQAQDLMAYGADRVIYVEDEKLGHYTTAYHAHAMSELVNERKPEILFMGASYLGRDLASRIAARIATGLTADCTSLDVDEESRDLLMTRPAFGGNIMATIRCSDHRPQMSTVRPGVFDKIEKDMSKVDLTKIEKTSMDLASVKSRLEVLEVVKEMKKIADLTEVEYIVSGGRGVGAKENFAPLEELAEALGGVVGGSRASTENGWIDHGLQVGQTGKTVKPKIYIACGISGAVQHMVGMQDSEFIIAINKDADAAIMKSADLALVGDLHKIVPELTEQIKALGL